MLPNRKRRLITVLIIFLGVSTAAGLVLYSLRENINLFYTPTTLIKEDLNTKKRIRVGGMVKAGSVIHAKEGLSVSFVITDMHNILKVNYTGVLPDLFREKQGVVVEGILQRNILLADKVLAKHDENYMPPGV